MKCAAVQRSAGNWGQTHRLLFHVNFMTDKLFSSLLYFLPANVWDRYYTTNYIKVYTSVYQSIHTHICLCVCMCKILQESGNLFVTAGFHKEFSCSSSCMYCTLWARALPSLDHWEVLEPSPARIREGELPLECLRNLCVLSFLCHSTTNTNWPNKIYPYLHQF